MYEQLDIFSLMQAEKEEPPILLSGGQDVFIVNKGDVIRYKVCNDVKSWLCGDNDSNRGYQLINERGGYDCTHNDKILNGEVFTEYEKAREKAHNYLKSNENVILAENIKPISVVAYSYKRDIDGREMVAFYCDLGNDVYYIKEFMTFHHICKGEKFIKKFMEQQDFKYDNPREIKDFAPNFKNMYKCVEQSDWDYAECKYMYTVG